MTKYRVGDKVASNIYQVTEEHPEGRYMGHACDPDDAALIVRALNEMAKTREWLRHYGDLLDKEPGRFQPQGGAARKVNSVEDRQGPALLDTEN